MGTEVHLPDLLVVDDDPAARRFLTVLLGEKGYRTRAAASAVEALLAIEAEVPDLVISDLRIPELDGLELLYHAKSRWPGLPIMLLTEVREIDTVIAAARGFPRLFVTASRIAAGEAGLTR